MRHQGCVLTAHVIPYILAHLDDIPLEMRVHKGDLTSPTLLWNGKFLRWYLQSRLSGAEKIIIGERGHGQTADGHDDRLRRLAQLPTGVLSKLGASHWSGDCCFTFLHTLMAEVQVWHSILQIELTTRIKFRGFCHPKIEIACLWWAMDQDGPQWDSSYKENTTLPIF